MEQNETKENQMGSVFLTRTVEAPPSYMHKAEATPLYMIASPTFEQMHARTCLSCMCAWKRLYISQTGLTCQRALSVKQFHCWG